MLRLLVFLVLTTVSSMSNLDKLTQYSHCCVSVNDRLAADRLAAERLALGSLASQDPIVRLQMAGINPEVNIHKIDICQPF